MATSWQHLRLGVSSNSLALPLCLRLADHKLIPAPSFAHLSVHSDLIAHNVMLVD